MPIILTNCEIIFLCGMVQSPFWYLMYYQVQCYKDLTTVIKIILRGGVGGGERMAELVRCQGRQL